MPTNASHNASVAISNRLQPLTSPTIASLGAGLGARLAGVDVYADAGVPAALLADLEAGSHFHAADVSGATGASGAISRWWQRRRLQQVPAGGSGGCSLQLVRVDQTTPPHYAVPRH